MINSESHKVNLKNKVTYSVRASQAVLQYGVGAMVDFRDRTLMTASHKLWGPVVHISDERLEKMLNVSYFGRPGDKNDIKYQEGVAYVRFPEWYFCPCCRRFKPIKEWVKEYRMKNPKVAEKDPHMVQSMKCPKCHKDLVVARIIVACEDGHIDDFPWVKWVHCCDDGKPVCKNPDLTISSSGIGEGLGGIILKCNTCGARASLRDAFTPGKFEEYDGRYGNRYNFRCTGRHPWKNSTEQCKHPEYPKVLQRGSSSVYFPVTESSLVIPPYSSIITNKIQDSIAYSEYKRTLTDMIQLMGPNSEGGITEALVKKYAEKISLETTISVETVKEVLDRKNEPSPYGTETTSDVKYRAEEYEAITGERVIEDADYGEFLREGVDIERYNLPYLKSISLIHKVREVQALIGFSRLKPIDSSDAPGKKGVFVSIKEDDSDWYPAYDVRGEGIFIEFDPKAIEMWQNGNKILAERVTALNEAYKKSFIAQNHPRNITSKFLLLHTVAHLLIKQLSFECGYGIASLKERIYCSDADEGKEMSGILIYTACGDSEGTLGGLVRQGRSDTFPKIFNKAMESARTCSNDPVCSLSQGQGRDSLNFAACYACTLIPETSCEEYNTLLDRGVVIGTYDNPQMGFFGREYERKTVRCETVDTTPVSVPSYLYKHDGTDTGDCQYIEIWNSVLSFGCEEELELLEKFSSNEEAFKNKEKPCMDGTLYDPINQIEYRCDLIWEKSKVAFFTRDNEEIYDKIKYSEWKCFCSSDDNLTFEEISDNILEEV